MSKSFFRTFKFVAIAIFVLTIQQRSSAQTLSYGEVQVKTVKELVNAVNNGKSGDLIRIFPGVYELDSTQQLNPKRGMIIKGSGMALTTLKAAQNWNPGLKGLPADEVDATKSNTAPYLFKLENTSDVKILNMTLTAPKLHGAIFANKCQNLEFYKLNIHNFIWSSILTFDIEGFKIHDCNFTDAGGNVRWMGAAIFSNRTIYGEYYNNKITSSPGNNNHFVGFKARGSNYCRIHHNTVQMAFREFSLEYMHERNHFVEIDHNNFNGTMSLPFFGPGGDEIPNGYSFWVHHNYLTNSYAIEGPRSYLIVENNYFDFPIDQDGGNLYTDHDKHKKEIAHGHICFRNNQIKNPGRGIFWTTAGIDKEISIINNHVIANRTVASRELGLFSFIEGSDYSTIMIKNNIVDCVDFQRPLLDGDKNSNKAIIENNQLNNVSDVTKYTNQQTTTTQGLSEGLNFKCGYRSTCIVNGWDVSYTSSTEIIE